MSAVHAIKMEVNTPKHICLGLNLRQITELLTTNSNVSSAVNHMNVCF